MLKFSFSIYLNYCINTHSLSIVEFQLYLYQFVHSHFDHHGYPKFEYSMVQICIEYYWSVHEKIKSKEIKYAMGRRSMIIQYRFFETEEVLTPVQILLVLKLSNGAHRNLFQDNRWVVTIWAESLNIGFHTPKKIGLENFDNAIIDWSSSPRGAILWSDWFTGKSRIGISTIWPNFENYLDLFRSTTIQNFMQHIIVQE